MIKILIAEDHQALIDGIQSYLKSEKDIKLLDTANDGERLLELVDRWRPDVVLCDIRMPKIDGIEATREISEHFPDTRVIGFTMFDQTKAAQRMMKAGAVGYISKNSPLEIVLEGIRKVAAGQQYIDKKIHIPTETIHKNSSKSILSDREKQVLQLIANGMTSREIADKLFIGKNTVNTHRKNMVRKLELSGNGELMRYAIDKKYDFE